MRDFTACIVFFALNLAAYSDDISFLGVAPEGYEPVYCKDNNIPKIIVDENAIQLPKQGGFESNDEYELRLKVFNSQVGSSKVDIRGDKKALYFKFDLAYDNQTEAFTELCFPANGDTKPMLRRNIDGSLTKIHSTLSGINDSISGSILVDRFVTNPVSDPPRDSEVYNRNWKTISTVPFDSKFGDRGALKLEHIVTRSEPKYRGVVYFRFNLPCKAVNARKLAAIGDDLYLEFRCKVAGSARLNYNASRYLGQFYELENIRLIDIKTGIEYFTISPK